MIQPLVAIEGVDKWFGDRHVLRGIDLEVAAGEVVAVVGPPGSGKSTLCRTINRLEPVDRGRILIDGEPLPSEGKALANLRADVGMVFGSFNLFAHRTVLENVTLGPIKVRGQEPDQAASCALRRLDQVGLADAADALPPELTGGEQQRVAIARVLALDPKVVLFDDPTGALGPDAAGEVLEVMRELADDGTTMIVVTGELGFVRRTADRVVFMDDGRIVEVATPDRFFAEPATDGARDFLAASGV